MTQPDECLTTSEDGVIFLLDGNNMAYRAFFALPETIATSTGFVTNALYGFSAMILKILGDYRPRVVVVAWDSREKTFRHEEFEEYKAQRRPMPDLLSEQWPYFADLCEAFGFVNVALPGYEADDILGTLARQADRESREAVIVTGDKDALQLVTKYVRVMANARGVTDVKVYDSQAVQERFGIPPALIPDLIGLKGDTSDNIPGVPGIGEKTAADLLARFGSVEGVLEHVDDVGGAKRKELLREHADTARLSKKLALIDKEVPIDIHAPELHATTPNRERLRDLFMRFEFTSLLGRLDDVAPAAARPEAGGAAAGGVLEVFRTDVAGLARELRAGDNAGVFLEEEVRELMLAKRVGQGRWAAYGLPVDPECEGPLREILRRVDAVCHDFKGTPALRRLIGEVAHDTLLAAYLLAPGRRSYPLAELLAEARLSACRAHVEVGAANPAAGAVSAEATGAGADLFGAGASAAAAAGVAADASADASAGLAADILRLAEWQEERLRIEGMWELLRDVELPLTRVLIDMEKVGVHLDCYRLGEITARLEDRMDALEDTIYGLAGGPFNLGSPAQLGEVLFGRLGLPRQRKTKTGYSTDAKTLAVLHGAHPIIEAIEGYRELSKLMSTYLLALPEVVDPDTGRLHTTFHQTVAATGRLSSSDPNLQNIPVRTELGSQIRECFTAEEGGLLVVADYSQIELRLMAYLAQESALLEALRRGEDIHTRTAAEVFGLEEEEVSATHRRYAKAVNFGILYGISAFGLSQQLNVAREEAAAYIDRYFERMPNVRRFIDTTIADAREQGFVATLFGRRRAIPELHSDNFQTRLLGERLAVNSVIQGSAADIIKVAMIKCHALLAREFPCARLVLQVHDELIFETPEADAAAVRDAVCAEMVAAFDMEPPLAVDAGVGPDWLAAK